MKTFKAICLSIALASIGSAEEYQKSAYLEIPLPEARIEHFLNGRAKIAKSDEVLRNCVEKLKLADKWSVTADEAVAILAKKITVSREAKTDLLRVDFQDDSEVDTDHVLRGIVDSIVNYLYQRNFQNDTTRLELLDKSLVSQKELVDKYHEILRRLIREEFGPVVSRYQSDTPWLQLGPIKEEQEARMRYLSKELKAIERQLTLIG